MAGFAFDPAWVVRSTLADLRKQNLCVRSFLLPQSPVRLLASLLARNRLKKLLRLKTQWLLTLKQLLLKPPLKKLLLLKKLLRLKTLLQLRLKKLPSNLGTSSEVRRAVPQGAALFFCPMIVGADQPPFCSAEVQF